MFPRESGSNLNTSTRLTWAPISRTLTIFVLCVCSPNLSNFFDFESHRHLHFPSSGALLFTELGMSLSHPTEEDKEELLLSCRYGDLEDIQTFVNKFGPDPLNDVRDESGNCVLHMVAANGHTGMSPPLSV